MKSILTLTAVMTAACGIAPACASVILHGTRIVYPGDARDVTIAADNEGKLPVLVQAWLDDGNPSATPEESRTPFVLTPPIFRLDPQKSQSLRIIRSADTLPRDKESLFWLNVLEVPPQQSGSAAGSNQLRLIFRSRIKMFYRPAGLPGKVTDAPGQVRWRIEHGAADGGALIAYNPTPYHVTFSRISTTIGGVTQEVTGGAMVGPGEEKRLTLSPAQLKSSPSGSVAASKIDYAYINDFGVSVNGRAELNAGT